MARKHATDVALDAHLAQLLERIGEVARALRWQQATDAGLSPLQIRILGFVAEHAGEAVGVARLADEFQVSRPTVSDSVALLVERSLLLRKPDPHDGRSHALRLSAEGRRVLPTGGPFTESLATLPLHERESLLLGLMRLLEALLSRGDVQVQRMCWTCAHYNGDRRGRHRCLLLRKDLAVAELRTDCPEHEAT
ncbi:MAG: MarR family transcriptional regulator [Flavobacteriales bacterium]|jgi:DNA-binding MarR family transcriptional regulator|nr:MarR family transcriptional regulator [Flavobacteriales bacterium]MBK9287073.1 MarR family transcriptional regulator [Flavobacteriales bacterium]MCC7501723.1 MarR family transcriptional regulator [Flavobacteriales bacterium]